MIYFDSSAIVKRFLEEAGSAEVNNIIRGASLVITSKLTYPEILSAFTRKYKEGDIPKGKFLTVMDEFEKEWSCFMIIEFKDELFSLIKKLIVSHNLRAADSIHLSSALWLKHSVKEDITFVTSDVNLLRAAHAEKLHTINPQKR
jgi:hypothetical protein